MKTQSEGAAFKFAWRTPVGLMNGVLGEEGWLNLEFDLDRPRRFTRNDRRVELVSEDWNGTAPSTRTSADVRNMTQFLSDFFAGRRPSTSPRIGRRPISKFEAAVWKAAREISFGETVTYGELARRAGRPGGARAVGQAMGRNPLVLLIPCHRVLAVGSGSRKLGGFTGGLDMKRFLLQTEGTEIESEKSQPVFIETAQVM